MNRVGARTTLGTAAVAAALGVLAACGSTAGGAGSVEQQLVDQLLAGRETVSIPATVGKAGWREASILCPYDTADGASPAAQEVFAERGDFFTADDGVQWVVFTDGKKASVVEISRGRIDFCGNDSRAHVVTPADEFRLLGGTGEPGDPWVLGR